MIVEILILVFAILIVSFILFSAFCVYSEIKERKTIRKIANSIKVNDKFSYAWCENWDDPFETLFVDTYEIISVKENDSNIKWVKYKVMTISEDGIIVAGKDDDNPVVLTESAYNFAERIYSDKTNNENIKKYLSSN